MDGSDQIAQATVTISNTKAGDSLQFVDTSKIEGSLGTDGSGNVVLTLTAISQQSPDSSDFETALESVKFTNNSDTPDTATRLIKFAVTDVDGVTSSLATQNVDVTATNDTPVVDLNGATQGVNGTATFDEDLGPDTNGNDVSFTSGTINVSDRDSLISKIDISIGSPNCK